jgi:hypothetical protein
MNGNGSSIEIDMHSLLFILIVVKGDFREEVCTGTYYKRH